MAKRLYILWKGPFDYNMKEFLVGFELMGDALGFYRKIADQDGDPKSSIPIGGVLPANSSIPLRLEPW